MISSTSLLIFAKICVVITSMRIRQTMNVKTVIIPVRIVVQGKIVLNVMKSMIIEYYLVEYLVNANKIISKTEMALNAAIVQLICLIA